MFCQIKNKIIQETKRFLISPLDAFANLDEAVAQVVLIEFFPSSH
jgi:hypothetical protein